MLDMGFLPDLDRIVRLLPAKRQGLLFSATFSNEIRKLGRSFLNNPIEIEVAARNATAENVSQIAYQMGRAQGRTPVTHAHIVCRLELEKNKKITVTFNTDIKHHNKR